MADAQGNRYGPYDTDVAGSEAEAFTESAWHDAMAFLSGFVSGADLTFAGLTATLSATPSVPLHVWSHGGYIIRTDPWSIASPPTLSGDNPRRDLLVARRQRTVGATPGKTFLQLIQGTPAATPATPSHDLDDDEPLWSWEVPASGGTVVTKVLDHRSWLDLTGRIPSVKSRRVAATASGNLAGGTSVNIAATQTIPAAPFGPGVPYRVDVTSQIQTSIPAGLGVRLNSVIGATTYESDEYTNGGSAHTYTAQGDETHYVTGAAIDGTVAVSVSLTALAGQITVDPVGGEVVIELVPYEDF